MKNSIKLVLSIVLLTSIANANDFERFNKSEIDIIYGKVAVKKYLSRYGTYGILSQCDLALELIWNVKNLVEYLDVQIIIIDESIFTRIKIKETAEELLDRAQIIPHRELLPFGVRGVNITKVIYELTFTENDSSESYLNAADAIVPTFEGYGIWLFRNSTDKINTRVNISDLTLGDLKNAQKQLVVLESVLNTYKESVCELALKIN